LAKVQELRSALEQIGKERDRLISELSRASIQLDKARGQYATDKKLFEDESAKEESLTLLRKESHLITSAASVLDQIKSHLIDDLRLELSAEATRIFKSFTWKTDFFKEVRVGEDYLLELFDEFGRDMRDVMSAGETQLLSLAFILAMTAISDIEAPLVIDTPLARLDKTVRSNLVNALPGLTRQLVLLVTDSEMDAGVRSNIDAFVGADFKLSFVNGESSVIPGSW
jgi:DNA sulfur modification protein DndD